ncbi:YqaA family protein [Blastochloris viridis]|uniref:Lipoprotein B n=1 Tax=Blastochloris viridis TaxID=1079 RepID=A0A0H5B8V8_BLAVI|nr:YqaA family protein [Blastochloris viridis]ALK08092.1 SNARE associated Golgi protein [Blastochloris viridis]BAR98645.1 lipoprotein B [Blastochloris viridis]CUU44014.1 SNARE associated Golgi protein [Blastochloris viridis]
MLRRLYDAVITLSEKKSAPWYMGAVSFAESSFFPIPPDAMLVPMALARPDRAYFFALVCTLASVAGGLAGYAIGALLYDSVGLWIVSLYGYHTKLEAFRAAYTEWGAWIILIKGLTPIPYKLVTIASGFSGFNLFWFVVLSTITRGIRFFLLAFLLNRWGDAAREFIERRLGLVTAALAVIVVAGFVIAVKVI